MLYDWWQRFGIAVKRAESPGHDLLFSESVQVPANHPYLSADPPILPIIGLQITRARSKP